jgi:hypothetical protein
VLFSDHTDLSARYIYSVGYLSEIDYGAMSSCDDRCLAP